MIAAVLNWTDMAALLLRYGADPTAKSSTGDTVENVAEKGQSGLLGELIHDAMKNHLPRSAVAEVLRKWKERPR